jgi:hypothetical protein
MIIYLAIAGTSMVLFWVADADERQRLRAYAVTLGGGTAVAFLLFASYANRHPVCDALSPVWLSDALLAGALLYGLALVSPAGWPKRLGLAFVAGAIVAGFHVLMWPHCIQRLEGVSPEVYKLWLSHVREARPFYRHGWQIGSMIIALPITGGIGWLMLVWLNRKDPERLRRVVAAAAPGITATALLFWQTRTGPAAQMLAVPGAVAMMWILVPWFWSSRFAAVRVLGVAGIVLVSLGAVVPLANDYVPKAKKKPPTAQEKSIERANRLCNSLWGYHPVALQPKGRVFTFVDLAPRLITVTHHDSISGPYHRNGQQIADVMNAFRGSADQAHALITKYHSDYLLTCPNSSTTTIFMAETPKGFYAQLQRGQVPKWLSPVALPKDSPFRMWKVVG